jgi:hypothetical protein
MVIMMMIIIKNPKSQKTGVPLIYIITANVLFSYVLWRGRNYQTVYTIREEVFQIVFVHTI